MAQCTAATPAGERGERQNPQDIDRSAEVLRIEARAPGRASARARPASRSAEISAKTQTKPRVSLRNSAVRSAPCAAVSMGTKAKMMLLISTELSVSSGPMRHRQRIGVAVRAQQVGDQRHADDTQHVAGEDAGDNRQAAAHQWALHRAREITRSALTAGDDSVEFSPDLNRCGRASRRRSRLHSTLTPSAPALRAAASAVS